MIDKRKSWAINTCLNHPEHVKILQGNRPLIQPIYNSAKFTTTSEHPFSEQFIYGRVGNPTTRQLESAISEIQGREDTIIVSSGIAAISQTFLGLLNCGEHMISFRQIYKPARMFIRNHLGRFGIKNTIMSLSHLDQLESKITPETKLIHFESPTNPHLEVADIEAIIKIARKHGVHVSMDGTFGGLHQHKEFDIDVIIQSLTKFGNGHGDIIAGAISGRKELISKIRETSHYFGAHLDPQAAYLIMRGLKTYMIRYKHQCQTAEELARYLSHHPKIKKVMYPGLESHKGHSLARKQMTDMGAIMAFEIDPGVAESAEVFCHKLNLIQLAASVGSTESIICPTLQFFGLDLSTDEREELGINPFTVRLSVGLEDLKDLKEDFDSVLSV
jgi:cystathionine beta-lyase/cystathionine gamma-synthase